MWLWNKAATCLSNLFFLFQSLQVISSPHLLSPSFKANWFQLSLSYRKSISTVTKKIWILNRDEISQKLKQFVFFFITFFAFNLITKSPFLFSQSLKRNESYWNAIYHDLFTFKLKLFTIKHSRIIYIFHWATISLHNEYK